LRYLISVFCALVIAGCGDDINTSSSEEVFFAVGGIVKVANMPAADVSITIRNSENIEWVATSNNDGVWRVDGPLKPDTYTVIYSVPDLPEVKSRLVTSPNSSYYYSNASYNNVENDYIFLGEVNLSEIPLEATVAPFSVVMRNQDNLFDSAGGQEIQYSYSNDNDIVITFNYPLWHAGEVCLLDINEVPLFEDTTGDGQGDYPLCAKFNAVDSTFTLSRSSLDQAYLGLDSYGFVGTSTMTGLVADNILSTHYLLWVGVTVVDNTTDFYLYDYSSDAYMQAFSSQYGTEFNLQGKIYFNVVP